MKRFGRLLIDAGIISSDQLAEALLFQLRQSPSAISVLYESGSLTAQEILSVLDRQAEDSVDVRVACEGLGLWKPEFEEYIRTHIMRARPTLGQILVERGLLKPEVALRELHRLDASRAEETETLSAPSTSQTDSPVEQPEPAGSTPSQSSSQPLAQEVQDVSALSEFEPKFPDSPHESLEGYFDLFTDDKRAELECSILVIETSPNETDHAELVAKAIDDTYGGYHSIKGAARTVGGVLTEHLVHQAEDLLSFFKTFWTQVPEDRLADLITINLKVLDVIWALREELHERGSEEEFWENESDRFKFLSLVQSLASQLEIVEGLGLKVDVEELNSLF